MGVVFWAVRHQHTTRKLQRELMVLCRGGGGMCASEIGLRSFHLWHWPAHVYVSGWLLVCAQVHRGEGCYGIHKQTSKSQISLLIIMLLFLQYSQIASE